MQRHSASAVHQQIKPTILSCQREPFQRSGGGYSDSDQSWAKRGNHATADNSWPAGNDDEDCNGNISEEDGENESEDDSFIEQDNVI